MSSQRKYWFSQRFEVKDIGGELILFAVVRDLSDTNLQKQFDYYLERQDYEYLTVLVAEANYRGLKLKNKTFYLF